MLRKGAKRPVSLRDYGRNVRQPCVSVVRGSAKLTHHFRICVEQEPHGESVKGVDLETTTDARLDQRGESLRARLGRGRFLERCFKLIQSRCDVHWPGEG